MKTCVSRQFDGIPEGYVCLGHLMSHFGLRGEMKVFLDNADSDFFKKARDS